MFTILHITHPWGGGVSSYIEDLTQASAGMFNIYVLTCWEGRITLTAPAVSSTPKKLYSVGRHFSLTDCTDENYARILGLILDEYCIDLVQINSHVGHTFDIFSVPTQRQLPIVLVAHDFFYICPTFHLVNRHGQFCHICALGREDNACLKNHDYLYSDFNAVDLSTFRKTFQTVISAIDAFVFPSHSTREIFSHFYDLPPGKCHVIPHGSPLVKQVGVCPSARDGVLRVGILGSLLKHKGQAVIHSIVRDLKDAPIFFVHFGDGALGCRHVLELGRYDRHAIVGLLQAQRIDVCLLLSTWPETFSYTLTESFAANIPPIVTHLGALAERVLASNAGWVVDPADLEGVNHLLQSLAANPTEIDEKKKIISGMMNKSLAEMCADYQVLYRQLVHDPAIKTKKVLVILPCSSPHRWQRLSCFGPVIVFIKLKRLLARVRRRILAWVARFIKPFGE